MGTELEIVQRREMATTGQTEAQRMTLLLEALWQKYSVEKIDSLETIITKSRLSVDQAPPEGLSLISLLEAWASDLEDLTPQQVLEYHKRATKAKTNNFMVNSLDILTQWNKYQENRRLDRHYPEEQRGKWY